MGALAAAWSLQCVADEPRARPTRQPRAKQSFTSKFRDPEDGQIDLSRFLATPRRFMPIPLVVTEPAVGYGGGTRRHVHRARARHAGSEGFARPNISIVAGIATENGTWAAFAGDSSHWFDDRVQSLAGGGTGEINLDFYGLGDASESLDEPSRATINSISASHVQAWKSEVSWSIGCATSIRRSNRSCATTRCFQDSPIPST